MPEAVIPKPRPPAPQLIDEQRVQAQGIRRLSSKHLTLYTDLPLDEEIQALPEAFDQAYPQWRDYFHLTAPEKTSPARYRPLDEGRFQVPRRGLAA